jgi:hypothetical protein
MLLIARWEYTIMIAPSVVQAAEFGLLRSISAMAG